MKFRKRGAEVRSAIEKVLERDAEALEEAQRRFEREKEKSALQRARELELRIERFQRVLRHTTSEEVYELTEQDLIDFDL